MDNQDIRISEILGKNTERCEENSLKYLKYLKDSISLPCELTGMEDFPWEEKYVLGGWDKEEYEELKKDNPSFRDKFSLTKFLLHDDEDEIFAQVQRIKDGKIFEIGISWLECTNEKSPNYIIVEDCASWHVNY